MPDVTLPDNAAAGTIVAAIAISMSDGSTFTGTLEARPPELLVIIGRNLMLMRNLSPSDGGETTWFVRATQDGISSEAELDVLIIPIPTRVEFDPETASLADNTPADTEIAAIFVTMSDGSDFAGSLTASPPHLVKTEDGFLLTTRMLTAGDVGNHTLSVTAT